MTLRRSLLGALVVLLAACGASPTVVSTTAPPIIADTFEQQLVEHPTLDDERAARHTAHAWHEVAGQQRAAARYSAQTVHVARPAVVEIVGESSVNGYACGGGSLPYCWVMRRESKGVPTAVNPTGCGRRTCGGLWQFDPVTWSPGCTVALWNRGACSGYGGFLYAQDAPAELQQQRAREVWQGGAGCSHWGACR